MTRSLWLVYVIYVFILMIERTLGQQVHVTDLQLLGQLLTAVGVMSTLYGANRIGHMVGRRFGGNYHARRGRMTFGENRPAWGDPGGVDRPQRGYVRPWPEGEAAGAAESFRVREL